MRKNLHFLTIYRQKGIFLGYFFALIGKKNLWISLADFGHRLTDAVRRHLKDQSDCHSPTRLSQY